MRVVGADFILGRIEFLLNWSGFSRSQVLEEIKKLIEKESKEIESEEDMTKYNYKEAVMEDVKSWIEENEIYDEDELNDILLLEDSVTGNASGSYTMSRWKAEENLCHNWEEIVEAAEEFCLEPMVSEACKYCAEWWDVLIRCRYLPEAIHEVLEEMKS